MIDGTPWRLNILDIVAPERAADWTDAPAINPGPFQFHSDPEHARSWMRSKGWLFCRKGEIREIMRPIPVPSVAITSGPSSSFAAESSWWGLSRAPASSIPGRVP